MVKKTENKKKFWFVYIIETQSGKFYTGITKDLDRRFQEHKKNKKGAKFFRTSKAKKIIYQERCKNRSFASRREHEIKQLKRTEKLLLIQNQA